MPDDFIRRVKANRKHVGYDLRPRVALLYFSMGGTARSWWVLIFGFLLFDIYITGYIPLTWWKSSKNPAVRGIMSWVDAIVYALMFTSHISYLRS